MKHFDLFLPHSFSSHHWFCFRCKLPCLAPLTEKTPLWNSCPNRIWLNWVETWQRSYGGTHSTVRSHSKIILKHKTFTQNEPKSTFGATWIFFAQLFGHFRTAFWIPKKISHFAGIQFCTSWDEKGVSLNVWRMRSLFVDSSSCSLFPDKYLNYTTWTDS